MAQYDGSIRINTQIDTRSMKKGFSDVKAGVKDLSTSIHSGLSTLNGHINGIGSKFKSMGSAIRKESYGMSRSVDGLSGSFKRLGATIVSAFAVRKVAGFAGSMTELGSDLEEVQNVVDVTFTTMSDKIDEFAKNAAKSAGLSETMAKRYAGTFGAMSKSFGFAEQDAYSMSTALTQLAGDVASFYNISQDEAYTKLKSVFTGETETLKDLGVVMTENALNSYAMAKGIGKSVSKMTEQQKVALRYQFVLEKLSGATGDFVRTQDSWANQTRILKLQIESLKATIGQGLINAFTPLLKMLNTLLAKLKTVANAFKSFTESFFGKSSSTGTGSGYKDYADSAGELAGSLENVTDSAEDAEKALEGYLSPLDEINKYTTGKDDNPLSDLEDIDFGNMDNLNLGVTITPEVDESGISGKFRQLAEKIKGILQSLFNPLKEAWDREGQFVMDSWKYALDEVWSLIKDIGRDFLTVWQQEGTITIFQDILHIIGDIGLVVGNLARNFREAWNENEVGLHILENIRDIIGIIVGHIRNAADATAEWSDKLDFYPLLESFNRFLESLEPVVDAISGILEDFYTEVLLPLGQWVLEEGLPKLLQVFIDFNNKVDWDSLRSNIAEFWEHLEPFAETVGEGLIIFIGRLSDVLANFINSPAFSEFLTMIENWMDSVTPEDVADAFQKIATAIVALKVASAAFTGISAAFSTFSGIAAAMKGTLSLLHPVISLLGGALSALTSPIGIAVAAIALLAAGFVYLYNNCESFKESMDSLYEEYIKPFFDSISAGLSDIKEKFMEFWNGNVKPILDEWGQKFDEVWNEHIKPALDKVKDALGTVVDALKELWEGVLGPLIEWIIDYLFPVFLRNIDDAVNTTLELIGWVFDAVGGLADIIADCIGLIVDLLKGDWAGAWEHARSIVETVWDGITGTINRAVQKIKGWVNDLLELFGKAEGKGAFSVGDSGSYSRSASYSEFSLPTSYAVHPAIAKLSNIEIPGYATGQVIPTSMKRHLAWLGDNPRETEVVSPLSTIRQAQKEALVEALSELGLSGGGASVNSQPIIVKLIADGRELTDLVINNGKVRQMSAGSNPFLLGTT